jgi:hypothetical protein
MLNKVKITDIERQAFSKQVVHFYENYANKNLKITCNYFVQQGKFRQSISRIISRYKKTGTAEFKKKLGRKPKIMTKKVIEKVKKNLESDPELTDKEGAKKAKLKLSTYRHIRKKKLGIKTYVKEVAPIYVKDQEKRAKKSCRKLYRKSLPKGGNKVFLIDDETYVPFDYKQVPGKQYIRCKDKSIVPDNIRFKGKAKFPKKYMIWQCIDSDGNISDPFISVGTMNSKTYLNECLKKILMPFIDKHHNRDQVLLWMDLATCHYSNQVIEWLNENNIEYVEKTQNAPNVPQVRPIEKFWSLCKTEYRLRKKQAKNMRSFKIIWRNISKKVAEKSAQQLFKHFKKNLRAISEKGVFEPLKK